MLTPVLLSGGIGSRLWPLSRELYPKQFLALTGEQSLLAATAQRATAIAGSAAPIVVCNDEHRFLVAEQLRQCDIDPAAILLEPVGRNTAPAVAAAALQAVATDPEAVLLVMPADHVIADTERFSQAVTNGLVAAQQGKLVTFGIIPLSPETGYGYIQAGAEQLPGCQQVAAFVEKPDRDTAQAYLNAGDYYWNSGIFLFAASSYLEEMERFAPEMLQQVQQAMAAADSDLDFIRLHKQHFSDCPSDSIDYAIMEHTDRAVVVPMACGWSDVGAWSTLWDIGAKDAEGNVASGDVLLHDTHNCYVASNSRLVATTGVENLVVVETADALLVADKDKVQDIKAIVSRLKQQQRDEVSVHTRVYRPWGSYESLVVGERFQVKRIIVNPGQRLSLQMHHHRAEHWVVVSGTAKVVRGEETLHLTEDQSTYIPLGTRHRLENPGVIPLEVIEVQTGSYLGEDDIVRFDDVYGRKQS